ncbi:dihydropteroate synthase [Alteromonadaceae bacterium BrNp21-10]|nr:dihydropteroate synthase [Alteromonadaceae bacterium BrNp21-10]
MQFADRKVDLTFPQVMGILNVTPDSFSDGGHFNNLDSALAQARKMVEAGATFIDVGGESTRPGAADVSLAQELQRVVPVIELLRKELDCTISIDTSKAAVMTEAVKAGAGLINDIRALQESNALETAVDARVPVCLMHMQGQPRTMQIEPVYDDVVNDVKAFLQQRIECCMAAGIPKHNILLDPGFGFGKSVMQNYALLRRLTEFNNLGCPLLVGLSRKSMLGQIVNKPVEQRLAASVAAATLVAMKGAKIIRVHDVQQTVDAIKIVNAMENLQEN